MLVDYVVYRDGASEYGTCSKNKNQYKWLERARDADALGKPYTMMIKAEHTSLTIPAMSGSQRYYAVVTSVTARRRTRLVDTLVNLTRPLNGEMDETKGNEPVRE